MDHVFHDSEFLSARDKTLVLKAWVRFLKNGLRFEDFSDRLYKHLTLHCSFIAHYNRAGFYAEYFDRGEDTARFLSQFDDRGECRSVEYGGSWWFHGEYADINEAMIAEGTSTFLLLWNAPMRPSATPISPKPNGRLPNTVSNREARLPDALSGARRELPVSACRRFP